MIIWPAHIGQRYLISFSLVGACKEPTTLTRLEDPSMTKLMVGGIAALALAMGIGRFAYTPVLPSMQLDQGFDNQLAGIIASANYLGYFIGAFAAGAVPKQWSRTRVLRVSLLSGLVTTAVMAATDSAWIWIALRFLSGLASAGILVLVTATVLEHAARLGRTYLAAILFGGVGLGIAISGLAVLLLDPRVGWRGDWLGLAGISGLLLIPAWLWIVEDRGTASAAATEKPSERPYGYPLIYLILAYFCEGAGYIVSGTFLVAIVQALPGLAAYGEVAWIIVGLAGVPSCLLWAAFGARFGLIAALIAAHLVQACGIVLPLVSASPLIVVLAAVLFGGTFMGITTLTVGLAGRIAPANRAQVVGRVTAAFGLGQIFGPIAAGAMADRAGDFELALIAAAAMVVLGALLLLIGRVQSVAAGSRSLS